MAERPRTPDDLRQPDAAPIEDEVRLRAYELYLARGDADGNETDDWLRAEREVRSRTGGLQRGDSASTGDGSGMEVRPGEIGG